MFSKVYPYAMKGSGLFLRSNSDNFHPPLNRHVPAAWLPRAEAGSLGIRGETNWRHFLKSQRWQRLIHSLTHSLRCAPVFEKSFFLSMVESCCVVQKEIQQRSESRCVPVGPTEWYFVRTKRKNLHLTQGHVFLYLLGSHRGKRAFDPSQHRKI